MDTDADTGARARRGEPRGRRRSRRRRSRAVLASRRARQSIDGVREGDPAAARAAGRRAGRPPASSFRTRLDGRRERLVYFSREGDLAAYEELRSGFTAAVSHELRTPLARLLTLLETATLPGEDVVELVEQATREVEQITELIDEILFLSELESGARVVVARRRRRFARCSRRPSTSWRSARAGQESSCDSSAIADVELAIRPRMLRVLARNLAENAIRYAGPGTTSRSEPCGRTTPRIVLSGSRRRDRRRGVVAPAAVRALLPGRPGSSVSRHRARSRDRQAHRDAGRGNRRCAGRARQGPRDPLLVRRPGC